MHDDARDIEPLVTAEERARLAWETDPLVQLLGCRHEWSIDLSTPSAARFYDWLARELRARQAPDERLTPERVERMAYRMRSRIEARRLGVKVERRPFEALSAPEARARRAERIGEWVEGGVAAGAGLELSNDACERFVVVPPDAPAGRYVALTVRGDSMEPLVESGDVVLVRRRCAIERSTVIVARHPEDGYVVKEVGRIKRDQIELRSLNVAFASLYIPNDPRLVVGTVVRVWRARSTR